MENSKKHWTKEDEEYLLDSYGILSMKKITKELKRTELSVRIKFLELAGFQDINLAGGLLSPPQVADALGVDSRTILDWIHNRGLKAKQLNRDDRLYRYFLEPATIWKWVKDNKERVNFARIKRDIILPEPSWVQSEISKSVYVKRPKPWTEEEDRNAYRWWQNGINYKEIAKRLQRPEKGTQRRLTHLKKVHGGIHRKTKSYAPK